MARAPQEKEQESLPQLGPELEFLSLLWELNHALESGSRRVRGKLGVTTQQHLLLRIVGRFPELTAGVLSQLLHINPGTLSTALARLEKRGLLVRMRGSPDRRRVTIGLTAAGRALDQPASDTVERAVGRLLATTSAAELSAARRCVRALALELKAAPADSL